MAESISYTVSLTFPGPQEVLAKQELRMLRQKLREAGGRSRMVRIPSPGVFHVALTLEGDPDQVVILVDLARSVQLDIFAKTWERGAVSVDEMLRNIGRRN